MAIYLNEEQFGRDRDLIGFPNVLLCMGLVVVTRTWLYGLHLSWNDDTPNLAHALAAYVERNKSRPRALYGSCNFVKRYGTGGLAAWRDEMGIVAHALRFDGPAFGFDTNDIPPKPGTYLQFERKPHQERCRILFNQSTAVEHPPGAPARHHFWAMRQTGTSVRTPLGPLDAVIKEGQLLKIEQQQIIQHAVKGSGV